MNVGIIYARGRGSSLKKKNIYPLNGKPMLAHFMEELQKAKCLDHIVVWTECAEVADAVRQSGGIVFGRPREMVHYQSGFSNPKEWGTVVTDRMEKEFGRFDYCINLNCNYTLFRASSLDAMMDRLQADSELGFIYAVSPVQADIYMENHISGNAMPLFPSLPNMVRRMGISISDVHNGLAKSGYHEVSWEEGLDVQHIDDVPFAEYVLRKRAEARREQLSK